MEEVNISKETASKYDFTLEEALLLALMIICRESNTSVKEIFKILKDKRIILEDKGYTIIPYESRNLIDNILSESNLKDNKKSEIEKLASKLKEIFPKGKKEGTNQYWSEGTALIVKRLNLFYRKYGKSYTDEQILDAAKRYVESYKGDYRFMRTLKYFIWAEKTNAKSEVESTSDLLTYIENKEEVQIENGNWEIELKN